MPTAAPSAGAGDDPLRDQLLDAAARVFARQGFDGTKILDIVREAGLSTGAVYGRFKSKQDLLREAVVSRSTVTARTGTEGAARVADLVARGAALRSDPLTDAEALRLEAYITARREPDVAAALAEAEVAWRASVAPLVDAALADGTVADDVDPEAVLFLIRTLHLGLLAQRASGLPTPDARSWTQLIARVVASFGTTATEGEPHR